MSQASTDAKYRNRNTSSRDCRTRFSLYTSQHSLNLGPAPWQCSPSTICGLPTTGSTCDGQKHRCACTDAHASVAARTSSRSGGELPLQRSSTLVHAALEYGKPTSRKASLPTRLRRQRRADIKHQGAGLGHERRPWRKRKTKRPTAAETKPARSPQDTVE